MGSKIGYKQSGSSSMLIICIKVFELNDLLLFHNVLNYFFSIIFKGESQYFSWILAYSVCDDCVIWPFEFAKENHNERNQMFPADEKFHVRLLQKYLSSESIRSFHFCHLYIHSNLLCILLSAGSTMFGRIM